MIPATSAYKKSFDINSQIKRKLKYLFMHNAELAIESAIAKGNFKVSFEVIKPCDITVEDFKEGYLLSSEDFKFLGYVVTSNFIDRLVTDNTCYYQITLDWGANSIAINNIEEFLSNVKKKSRGMV